MNYLFNKESNLQGFSRQSGPLFQPLSSVRILYHRAFVRRHQNSQRAIVSSLRRFAWRIPQLRRKGRLQSFPQNLSRHGAGNVIPLDFRNHGFAIYDCIGCFLFFLPQIFNSPVYCMASGGLGSSVLSPLGANGASSLNEDTRRLGNLFSAWER